MDFLTLQEPVVKEYLRSKTVQFIQGITSATTVYTGALATGSIKLATFYVFIFLLALLLKPFHLQYLFLI